MATINFSVVFPGPADVPSLFDLTVLGQSVLNPLFPVGGTLYDAWCLDKVSRIGVPSSYTGTLYSPYETTVLANGLPVLAANVAGFDNLDSIVWLINAYTGLGTGFTDGEVQAAIWTLMGQDWTTEASYLGPVAQANVDILTAAALANDGYVPAAGEFTGLIVAPVDGAGNPVQTLIVRAKSAQLGSTVWDDSNANGLLDPAEQGIAGAQVRLVRDLDNDGQFTSANEVIATTTTDVNGNYQFVGLTPGLEYQVLFTTPANYPLISPRQVDGSATADGNSDGLLSNVVILAPGENNVSIDAGFYQAPQPASLGDRVWVDVNGNGQQDPEDTGLAGVSVRLFNQAGTPLETLTTDGSGNYLFTNLAPGGYRVEVTLPQGYAFTTANSGDDTTDSDISPATGQSDLVLLAAGQVNRDTDAGLLAPPPPPVLGNISGKVLEDTNNDDIGDAPQAGVTVILKDAAGVEVNRVTTGADGSYAFNGVPAGSYSVHQVNAAGFLDVGDSDGGDPNAIAVTVVAGQTSANNDFVDERSASLGDRVWVDVNGNGQQDPEDTGLAGVSVRLFNQAGAPLETLTTDGSGNYLFTNLAPGGYRVEVTLPQGYAFTTANSGDDTTDSDISPATGQSDLVLLAAGQVNRDTDAGLLAPPPPPVLGNISGKVLEDTNNDDIGDAPQAGVTVILKDAAGVEVNRVTTGADGSYAFNGVPAGSYSVHQVNAAGFLDVGDSDGGDPNAIAVTVVAGQTSANNDFVDERIPAPAKAQIGNRVWEDSNANGVQDPGEAGIVGAQILLKDTAGNVLQTTFSGADGLYGFDVDAGTYVLQVVVPATSGYAASPRDAGGDPTLDSDIDAAGVTGPVTVAAGEVNNTIDMGGYRRASLGDRIWVDANRNGQQDTGEAGLGGVTVRLLDAAGNQVSQQTTNADGNYLFGNLVPGQYRVEVVKPTGYEFTLADTGDDASDSDLDAAGRSALVNLGSAQDRRDLDGGVYLVPPPPPLLGNICGQVLEDTNNDDIGDKPQAGVTVILKNAAGVEVNRVTTGADGGYAFNGVPAGSYTVHQVNAAGFQDVKDSDGGDPNAIAVTLAGGQTSLGNDFVDERIPAPAKAQIGNRVWEDSNANGVQDPGEAGIVGAQILLKDTAGNLLQTTFSGADGLYGFNVDAGTYVLQVVVPATSGYAASPRGAGGDPTLDSDIDAAGVTGPVTVAAGEVNTTIDMGGYRRASLGDRIWVDANRNGQQDTGEAGLGGVTVRLLDAAGNEVSQQTTNADGNYLFGNLVPGQYRIEVVKPTGHEFTLADTGDDASDSDLDAAGRSALVNLGSAQDRRDLDGGVYLAPPPPPLLGNICGQVLEDTNNDDIGDKPQAGVTVILKNAAGVEVNRVTTGADGGYAFNGVPAGSYTVHQVNAAGFQDVKDSDGGDPNAIAVTLAGGQTSLGNDFVDERIPAPPKAHIGDRVFLDKNANGVQDDGEAGIAQVKVELLNGSGQTVATTETDANGLYGFNVDAGTYSVKVTAPAGFFASPKDRGGDDAKDSDVDATGLTGPYTLAAGQVDKSADAGWFRKATLGDKVFFDANRNGVQDDGEVGAVGATVKLYDAAGALVGTKTTDASGAYLFTDLTPGSYKVQFTAPAGYSLSARDQGTDDAKDSDADPATGLTATVVLASGDDNRSVDAGVMPNCRPVTFGFNGNHPTDGTDGNSLSWTDSATGVKVTALAFSQDKGTNTWQKAYVGAYAGGLGVTDSSEGNGSGNLHTIDNVGRNNYVVLQFSQAVSVDKLNLGYVSGDSDFQMWVGNSATPITAMSNAVLSSMSWTESNQTTSTGARTADVNPNNLYGNVFIIAADTTDTKPGDYFKLGGLTVCAPNLTPPGAKGSIGDTVWEDKNANGLQEAGEGGVRGVTVKLLNAAGSVVATTTTDSAGAYSFNNLDAGSYKVQVTPLSGYQVTAANQGADDKLDSDISSTGLSHTITLAAGQAVTDVDAGLYRYASIGNRVWSDNNHNGVFDSGDNGIAGVKVTLFNTAGVRLATKSTDSAGLYSFDGLKPGDYVVAFDKTGVSHRYTPTSSPVLLTNWTWAKKNIGTDEALDSDVNNAGSPVQTTRTDTITVSSGEYSKKGDAGLTPLVIDLDGDGIETVSRADAAGRFDLLGTGTAVRSGWVGGDDGLLAVDRNGNGRIDGIGELFGGLQKGDGFAQLAAFDGNGDGVVDARDAGFAELRVWQDANGNQLTDAGELKSLAEAGIASLGTGFVDLPAIDAQGNLLLERGTATMADGRSAELTDVYFNVSADDAAAAGVHLPSLAELMGDDASLDALLGASGMAAPQAATADVSWAGLGESAEAIRQLAALQHGCAAQPA